MLNITGFFICLLAGFGFGLVRVFTRPVGRKW